RSCVPARLTMIVPLRGAPEGGCLWFIASAPAAAGHVGAEPSSAKGAPSLRCGRFAVTAPPRHGVWLPEFDDDNLFAERRWKSRATEGVM
ncbi:MAG TPA: hypothetical protein VEH77_06065, partial [Roseiarcus sp.]|nr:hypothetical protein [Roseiarcus sp.]